jgi:hypothetical protein
VKTVSIESLLQTMNRDFLPSPCILRSHAADFEREFDRDDPDVETRLREVFTSHDRDSKDFVDVSAWISWCMDSRLPKRSTTYVKQVKGPKIYNWLGVG